MTPHSIPPLPGQRYAVLNGKGGVGKTTSTVFFAEAGVRRGYSVTTLDADDQASLTEWTALAAEDSDNPPGWTTRSVNQFELNQLAQSPVPDGTLEIIDCPPKDPQILNLASEAADFVIVPTQPSVIDMRRVWKTLKNVGDTPAAVLIIGARLGTRLLEQTKEALDADQVPYFSTVIPLREEIRSAGNTVPAKLHGYDDVFSEIQEALK